MGNSEVGHLNIGAGRVVYQPLQFITKNIEDKTFFENKEFLEVINHSKKNNSKLHICGLLSDGGIHSHISHLFAPLELCKKENVKNLYLHLFTDGRDTLARCAEEFFIQLNKKIEELNIGVISTISGRYYAMDRDNNFDRIKKTYDAMVFGEGKKYSNYKELLDDNYKNDINDEFIIAAFNLRNNFWQIFELMLIHLDHAKSPAVILVQDCLHAGRFTGTCIAEKQDIIRLSARHKCLCILDQFLLLLLIADQVIKHHISGRRDRT